MTLVALLLAASSAVPALPPFSASRGEGRRAGVPPFVARRHEVQRFGHLTTLSVSWASQGSSREVELVRPGPEASAFLASLPQPPSLRATGLRPSPHLPRPQGALYKRPSPPPPSSIGFNSALLPLGLTLHTLQAGLRISCLCTAGRYQYSASKVRVLFKAEGVVCRTPRVAKRGVWGSGPKLPLALVWALGWPPPSRQLS